MSYPQGAGSGPGFAHGQVPPQSRQQPASHVFAAPSGPQHRGSVWIALGVAVALVATLITVYFVRDDAGPESAVSADPSAVAEQFMQALVEGDVSAANEFVCADPPDGFELDESEYTAAPSGLSYEIGEATVDGESATVPITLSMYGDSFDSEFLMVKEDGDWKVCGIEDLG